MVQINSGVLKKIVGSDSMNAVGKKFRMEGSVIFLEKLINRADQLAKEGVDIGDEVNADRVVGNCV